MSSSEPETVTERRTTEETSRPRESPVVLFLVALVLLPVALFAVAWSLVIVTNNLDVAYALGISEELLNASLIAAGGLLAGLAVGLVSRTKRWAMAVPAVAGSIVGVGVFVAFAGFDPGATFDVGKLGIATIWVAQAVAIAGSTRISGWPRLGLVAAVLAIGIGAAGVIRVLPAAPTEIVIVVGVYSVDEATGECWGVDELATFAAGSEVVLMEYPDGAGQSTEVGSVILPPGVEERGECRFEIGDPLGRPAVAYQNIDYFPLSEIGLPYSVSLEGERIIVEVGGAQG